MSSSAGLQRTSSFKSLPVVATGAVASSVSAPNEPPVNDATKAGELALDQGPPVHGNDVNPVTFHLAASNPQSPLAMQPPPGARGALTGLAKTASQSLLFVKALVSKPADATQAQEKKIRQDIAALDKQIAIVEKEMDKRDEQRMDIQCGVNQDGHFKHTALMKIKGVKELKAQRALLQAERAVHVNEWRQLRGQAADVPGSLERLTKRYNALKPKQDAVAGQIDTQGARIKHYRELMEALQAQWKDECRLHSFPPGSGGSSGVSITNE